MCQSNGVNRLLLNKIVLVLSWLFVFYESNRWKVMKSLTFNVIIGVSSKHLRVVPWWGIVSRQIILRSKKDRILQRWRRQEGKGLLIVSNTGIRFFWDLHSYTDRSCQWSSKVNSVPPFQEYGPRDLSSSCLTIIS